MSDKKINSRNKKVLERAKLYNLYWRKKKSTTEIAKLVGMSPAGVRYYLKKFGIKRRNLKEATLIARIKWKKNFPIKEIKRMYYKEKLSLSKIAKIIGVGKETIRRRMIEYGLSRRTLSEANSRYPTSPFSGNEMEKYYLIGFRSGDLSVVKSHNKIICSLSTTHPSMVHLFCELFSKYGHCSKTPRKRKIAPKFDWNLKAYLDSSFEFILEKPVKLPQGEFFYAFLAGYIDADGCWFIRKRSKNGINIRLSIITKDRHILRGIYERLKKDGYHPIFRLHKEPCKRWIVYLERQDEVISIARKLLPYTRHEEKIKMIKLILKVQKRKNLSKIVKLKEKLRKEIKKEVTKCVKKAEREFKKRLTK